MSKHPIRRRYILTRIILLTMLGPVILAGGMLFLSESRQTLTKAYEENLLVQARMIAGALADNRSRAQFRPPWVDDFFGVRPAQPFIPNLETAQAKRSLQKLVHMSSARIRVYHRDGRLLLDSNHLSPRGDVIARSLPSLEPIGVFERLANYFDALWARWTISDDLVLTEEDAHNGIALEEVRAALQGRESGFARRDEMGRDIVTVAVPVQNYRAIIGAIMVASKPGEIDEIIYNERMAVMEIFFIALAASLFVSSLLGNMIVRPIHALARAARQFQNKEQSLPGPATIPDLSTRGDEIGDLSVAMRDMTAQLLERIATIDRFAADVAHELKNPLTALHSATQALAHAKTKAQREELMHMVEHDVMRLSHLISDISNATRLDAELMRGVRETFNFTQFLHEIGEGLTSLIDDKAGVALIIKADDVIYVSGQKLRLAQVINNLVDNAVSFSKAGDKVVIELLGMADKVDLNIYDEGPGLIAGTEDKIFTRFYTDRPQSQDKMSTRMAQGKHSGLGLSISRQIARVHGGDVTAQNRDDCRGACFSLSLPRVVE